MKYLLLIFILTGMVFLSKAQELPAGKSFYIDYNSWNEGTKPSIFIDCGNSNDFNTGYELTMECWIRAYNFGWNRKVLGKMNDNLDNGYVLAFEAGHIYSEVFNPLANEVPRTGNGPMPVDSTWLHLATTFQAGGKMINYINGIEEGSVDVPANPIADNDNSFIIGIAPWDKYSYEFFGDIDEIKIWNVVKTKEELLANMHKKIIGDEQGLIGYYNFDDAEGTIAYDHSENSNNGIVNNADNNYWSWSPSYAPVGDSIMQTMNSIIAAWYGKAADQYNFALTESGLSMIADIEQKEYKKFIVFGHNNLGGVISTNAPENATNEFQRLKREWYVNIGDPLSAQIIFNLDQASDGFTLPINAADTSYFLLYRRTFNEDYTVLYSANQVSQSSVIFDDISLAKGYYCIGYDLKKLSGSTSITEVSKSEILIYPNPSINYFEIKNAKGGYLEIFTISGQRVLKQEINIDAQIINHALSNGIYFCKIHNNNKIYINKIVVKNL